MSARPIEAEEGHQQTLEHIKADLVEQRKEEGITKAVSGAVFVGVAVVSVVVTWGAATPVVVAAAATATGTMTYGLGLVKK